MTMTNLTYIYNSCFVLELEQLMLVFDFYKDTDGGHLERLLKATGKSVYVLASHFHADHFNRDCLNWANFCDAHYIFSHEIRPRIKRMTAEREYDITLVKKGDIVQKPGMEIRAFGSTDAGVSFLVRAEGKSIFHAGDLNNWHWRGGSTPEEAAANEKAYERELAEIAAEVKAVEIAMFPVDPRLGTDYYLGAEQFVSRVKTGLFAPMHFLEDYEKTAAFEPVARANGAAFFRINNKGDKTEWK